MQHFSEIAFQHLQIQRNRTKVNIMLKGFISYAHEDQNGCNKLLRQLKPLERNGSISFWADQSIEPGGQWKERIMQALAEADIALFLASPDMCYSDFIFDVELPFALQRWKAGTLSVIPVILRPCLWDTDQVISLGQLQAVPERSRAISTFASEDEGYYEAAQHIMKVVEQKLASNSGRERPDNVTDLNTGSKPRADARTKLCSY